MFVFLTFLLTSTPNCFKINASGTKLSFASSIFQVGRISMKKVTLYTDGACSGNPGIGGWGVVLLYGEHTRKLSGSEAETTNNRMELTAVIEGLKKLKYPCDVDVYSDSAYTVNGFLEGWVYAWEKSGWKKADRKPVLNDDLWRELLRLTRVHGVTFHKVKGHADNELNNTCDELARKAIEDLRERLIKDDPD